MADHAAQQTAQETPEQRARESVALRFTRLMNATTSPWGVISDPPVIALAAALVVIALLAAVTSGAGEPTVQALGALVFLPILVGLAANLALSGARRRVVAWLARQPFPIDNMNAVLNGLGDEIEVAFAPDAPALPATDALNAELDKVHPDAFVTESNEETRTIGIRIGVVDSKQNPAASNHRRYARVVALVEEVLVPLSERCPIASVRVK